MNKQFAIDFHFNDERIDNIKKVRLITIVSIEKY